MKILTKVIATGTALTSLSFASLTLAPAMVSADGTGQIEGGSTVYQIKNLTEGTPYTNSANAKACEELEYSIRLHNSGYTAVNNINVVATLPSAASTSNTSTMTATYTDGVVPSTTASATVNLDSAQSISYEAGTTKLYNASGSLIKTEGDNINSSGVNVGSLNGSTTEFLNFKAKINCPTPVTPAYSCDELSLVAEAGKTVKLTAFNTTATNGATFSNAVIDWGDNSSKLTTANVVGQTHQYSNFGTYTVVATANFSVDGTTKSATSVSCQKQVTFTQNQPPVVVPPATPSSPSTPAPTQLVNTGAGNIVGIFAATTAAGAAAYRFMVSRRLSRQ